MLAARPAMITMAAGILSFFLLEKAVIWRHCHHDEDCHVHSTAASLVIIGDVLHTFVDGAVIAAAVITSVPLGVTTALAVAAHEIPQEVGDVAILLRAGYSRRRAFTLNVLAGIGGILGAGAMVLASQAVPHRAPLRARVRGRQLSLRRDVRSDSRPAPRQQRRRSPAIPAHRRRDCYDRAASGVVSLMSKRHAFGARRACRADRRLGHRAGTARSNQAPPQGRGQGAGRGAGRQGHAARSARSCHKARHDLGPRADRRHRTPGETRARRRGGRRARRSHGDNRRPGTLPDR